MAKDHNNWTGIGNLVADPEMRFLTDGKAVTKFRIAVNGWKDGEVDFISIVCFGKLAEIVGEYTTKGKRVFVSGRLRIKSYEKEGQKKIYSEIEGNEVQILTPRTSTNNEQPEQEAPEEYDDIPF